VSRNCNYRTCYL